MLPMTDAADIMVSQLVHTARCIESHVPESGVRISLQRIGAAMLCACESWPHDIGFNRAYGVDATDRSAVGSIVTEFAQRGIRPLLEMSPGTVDASACAHLSQLGLKHLWSVTELMGDATPADEAMDPASAIHRMLPTGSDAFAELAVEAYECSPTVRPQQLVLKASICHDPQSRCLVGSIDGVSCAIGIMTFVGGIAVLSGGATLRSYRRRGLQRALLSQRIRLAYACGIHDFYVRAMPGSASQRNLERVGLRPRHLLQVWGHPLPA